MRDEVISTAGTANATTTASSAGASSPAFPANGCNVDTGYGLVSKVASPSYVGSQPPWTSLSISAGGPSPPSCRPWEREDLLRRLSTFKPSNWSGKPKVASSLACARRGWTNSDCDTLACEMCGSCLSFVLLSSWTPDEVENAGKVFANQLDTGHKITCPWRGNICPESLVQFPPTLQPALVGIFKDRCDGLLQFPYLPVVAASAVEQMSVSRGSLLEHFLSQPQNFTAGEVDLNTEGLKDLEHLRDSASFLFFRAQRLISLCGWEPRWLPNVQDYEEQTAQSARNGCSFGPTSNQGHFLQDPGLSKNVLSALGKKHIKEKKSLVGEPGFESRSPLLDCGLCGATVRMSKFLTVPQPARFASSSIAIPDTSKKMELIRGASAASGINGWDDDKDKDLIEDRDEVATSDGKYLSHGNADMNHVIDVSSTYMQLGTIGTAGNLHDAHSGGGVMIGWPSRSDVGDRAASYESRGPSSRKRSLEIGGSSGEGIHLRMQQVDSIEGVVIDKDNDGVTDDKQYSAGPSKRVCDFDMLDTNCSSYQKESSGAGPSCSRGLEIYSYAGRVASYRHENDQNIVVTSTRDSARESSVIAMDTICHGTDADSLDSVENYPGDVDDIDFPSSSIYGNLDMNETSELNNSNQVQQSICFQQVAEVAPGEFGVSSTNDGEEIFNANTVTPRQRDGFSFGVSGGSVGMCASYEAEIDGTDVSVNRTNSVVGDVEPKIEDVENFCQMGESAPDPGLMDEIIPEGLVRRDPHGNSQGMSHSAGRADSGSKVDCSAKAESVESGEKISESQKLAQGNLNHPSASCNAFLHSGCAKPKEVTGATKMSTIKNTLCIGCGASNGIGPPKGESNYGEATEFDPIIYHNVFCPWVNGNVAAAGSHYCGSGASPLGNALCGWQLTLDALDALQSLEQFPDQTLQSESAASLHKKSGKKLRRLHSVSRSCGQH